MIYFLFFSVFLLAFIFPKNKLVFAYLFLVMWILFGWSYGNADYMVHLNKYLNYENFKSQMEPLYFFIMKFFNFFNFRYESFLIVISFICLLVYAFFIKTYTKKYNYVFLLYFIFPFCFDVTMLRYTIAGTFFIFGLKYLFSDRKNDIIKYLICVFCASMIHFSFVFAIVFICIKFFSRKQIVKMIICANVIIVFFKPIINFVLSLFQNISFFNIGTKVSIVLTYSKLWYDSVDFIKYSLKVIILVIIPILIFKYILIKIKNKEQFQDYRKYVNLIININLCLLFLIPLMTFSLDMFRIQITMYIINYVFIIKYFDYRTSNNIRKVSTSDIIISILVICYSLSGLYLWICSSQNLDTVLYPFFNSNRIL